MVQVKTPGSDNVTNEAPLIEWTLYAIRPGVRAKLFPQGGTVGGVTIAPGNWAVAFPGGNIRSVDPMTFEASYIVP